MIGLRVADHGSHARWARRAVVWTALGLCLIGLLIAVAPERPARILTPREGWEIRGHVGAMTLREFPIQSRFLRDSVQGADQGVLFRSWTPDRDLQAIEVVSPPFHAPRFLSVAVTGATRTATGGNAAYLSCSTHPQRWPVFQGSVNVSGTEALLRLPADWCSGDTRLHLVTRDTAANAGVGTVAEVGRLSAWKQSFMGLLPYLAMTLAVAALFATAGSAAALRLAPTADPVLTAAASLGLFSLMAVLLYTVLPASSVRVAAPLVLGISAGSCLLLAGGARLRSVGHALRPYGEAWAVGALAYLALLWTVDNGLGHWNANYRFWPASWLSDNELPWMFAEALRYHLDLRTLFGGAWLPTDRAPLLTGAHLLAAEPLAWLQGANDGNYLRGLVYGTAAIALNTVWIPAGLHLLREGAGLSRREALALLVLVGLLPFALFNSTFGWPKLLAAAFGLLALTAALRGARSEGGPSAPSDPILLGILAALSILADQSGSLFILVLGGWVLARTRASARRPLAVGASLAMALLATWALYRHYVLPTSAPLARYALTGDYGFGAPGKGLLAFILDRYAGLTASTWLDTKMRMLLQPLLPLQHPFGGLPPSTDFAQDWLGRLRHADLLRLSVGNAVILAAAAATAIGLRVRSQAASADLASEAKLDRAARLALGLFGWTWFALALVLLAPLATVNWPHAAILVLACLALAWCLRRRPTLFRALAWVTACYTGLAWLIAPLHEALRLDPIALAVSVALFGALTGRVLFGSLGRDAEPDTPSAPMQEAARPRWRWSLDRRTWRLSWDTGHSQERRAAPLGSAVQVGRWPLLRTAAAVAALVFLGFALFTLDRPLLDEHAFRQTQTALSVSEMLQGGPKLGYYTPVLGLPWAIPFEAPVYHWTVAVLASLLPLEASGRLVSALYFIGAVYVGFRLLRRLLPTAPAAEAFALLAFASPLYLFWGRAFLIETCAVFFGMAHWALGLRWFEEGRKRDWVLATLAGALVALAKTTTWPAFVVALGLTCLLRIARDRGVSLPRVALLGIMIVVALAAGLAWTAYADGLKSQNLLARPLTSTALRTFNYGTLAQRFSEQLWSWSVVMRMLPDILGTLWFVAAAWFGWMIVQARLRAALPLAAGLLLVFFFPILVFTNLHVVHNYYQSANAIFLIMAVAICAGFATAHGNKTLAACLLASIVAGQYAHFRHEQWRKALGPYPDQPVMDAARFVRAHTDRRATLLALGVDWSSIAHYYAERRGVALRGALPDVEAIDILTHPARYVGTADYSAVLDCRATETKDYTAVQMAAIDALVTKLRAQQGGSEARYGPCQAIVGRSLSTRKESGS